MLLIQASSVWLSEGMSEREWGLGYLSCVATGSLAVKRVGPVTENLVVWIPEPTKYKFCPYAFEQGTYIPEM